MVKIGVVGSKGTTLDFLNSIHNDMKISVDCLITLSKDHPEVDKVAFYAGQELCSLSKQIGIKQYNPISYSLKNEQDEFFFKNSSFDLLFVIGWERLIPSQVLSSLSIGAFGMHGSAFGLPRGRGRSPLNWALINGHQTFITSLFKYEDGVDNGPVLASKVFEINSHDDILSLHHKNRICMEKIIEEQYKALITNTFSAQHQTDECSTFYPKREPTDGFIDWHLSTVEILRFVAALAPPYPCARTKLDEKVFFVSCVKPFDTTLHKTGAKVGEIIDVSISQKRAVVKAKDGLVLLDFACHKNFSLLCKGRIFSSVDTRLTLDKIRNRYPNSLVDTQKEI